MGCIRFWGVYKQVMQPATTSHTIHVWHIYLRLFCYGACKKQIPYTDGMGMQKGITNLKEMASLVMILQAI